MRVLALIVNALRGAFRGFGRGLVVRVRCRAMKPKIVSA